MLVIMGSKSICFSQREFDLCVHTVFFRVSFVNFIFWRTSIIIILGFQGKVREKVEKFLGLNS